MDDLKQALLTVLELAEQNVIDARDDKKEAKRQWKAIEAVRRHMEAL